MHIVPLMEEMHEHEAGSSLLLMHTAIPTIQGFRERFKTFSITIKLIGKSLINTALYYHISFGKECEYSCLFLSRETLNENP